jgi:hypothetical protein
MLRSCLPIVHMIDDITTEAKDALNALWQFNNTIHAADDKEHKNKKYNQILKIDPLFLIFHDVKSLTFGCLNLGTELIVVLQCFLPHVEKSCNNFEI